MGPVPTDGQIRGTQRESHRCADRLLASRQMHRAPHVALGISLRDSLLEAAEPLHLKKKVTARYRMSAVGCGHGMNQK